MKKATERLRITNINEYGREFRKKTKKTENR